VAVDGELLGKPSGAEDAARMLRLLSGREHRVLTGVAVALEGKLRTGCETTRVVFDEISEEQIAAYVASGEPFDKAGAYGIQGRASVFVKGIEGCYFNVVGLPLHLLAKLLESCGWPAWRLW
jgi:septum formation protein